MKRVILLYLCFFLLIVSNVVSAKNDDSIKVFIENQKVIFNNNPIIQNGVTLVQFRPIFEKMGFKIEWETKKQQITATKDNVTFKLNINNDNGEVNGEPKKLIVAPKMINGTTFIPLRFISENSGYNVIWNEKSRSINIEKAKYSFHGISIGDNLKKVQNLLGEPNRKDLSEYGFEWYVYNNKDYKDYLLVGIENEEVVGLSSLTDNWMSKDGVRMGLNIKNLVNIYGEPLSEIVRGGNNSFSMSGFVSENDQFEMQRLQYVYLIQNYYTYFFSDLNGDVAGIKLIKKEIEERIPDTNKFDFQRLERSLEEGIVDVINVRKVLSEKIPFKDNKFSEDYRFGVDTYAGLNACFPLFTYFQSLAKYEDEFLDSQFVRTKVTIDQLQYINKDPFGGRVVYQVEFTD